MPTLSERQAELLKTIIEEYIESAEPVGSHAVVEKYSLGVSSATIRNEMARLTEEGFLEKPHISAGRIPTSLAFRLYIRDLMEEKSIPVVSEVAIKQRLWSQRHELENLLQNAVRALADETQNLSLALTNGGKVYHSGEVHILRHPEFYDIDLTRIVLHLLDEVDLLSSIFERLPEEQNSGILLGQECGIEGLSPCGLIIARFNLPRGTKGQLGVLGPVRLNYPQILPVVKYFQNLINELSRGW